MTPMSPDLRQAVRDAGDEPVWLKDTETNAEYVLISAKYYQRVQSLVSDADPESMYSLLADLASDDWEDASNYGIVVKA